MPTRSAQQALSLLLGGLTLVAVHGCGGDRDSNAGGGSSPFVFRALDLRKQDPFGRSSWTLSSPEARYDIDNRIARAQHPSGTIFRDGKPAYRLTARIGTVLNDGMVVLLEGDIRLEQLGAQPLMIHASRARWQPSRQLLELDRHPEALDVSNRIRSRRARYLFDREELQLNRSPILEHWSQPFDPFRLQNRGRPEFVLAVKEAHWFPRQGRLEASGPLRGSRQEGASASKPATPMQTLRASALQGNTRQQLFTLFGPVQVRDSSRGLTLLARQLVIDGPSTTIRTAQPRPGQEPTSLMGTNVSAGVSHKRLNGSGGCLLLQRQDSLEAEACQWNWRDQTLQATGNVVLRRQEQQQESRGFLLVGSLGEQGRFRLSAPGGRVISRFQAPQAPTPSPPPPRPAPEPIRL